MLIVVLNQIRNTIPVIAYKEPTISQNTSIVINVKNFILFLYF